MSEEQLIATPCTFGENGNFLLERELGRGGMGGVYMGRDKMLDRPVAVKVMLKEYGSDPEFVEKFKREAQAAARLIHPNIAQIYSYGISDGMPYIAMELVAGGSLEGVMRNSAGATDVPRIMKICEQVAQALRCAADQGLVHGDVKPENVLLDANGNAKLVDFGLAAMQKDTNEIWGTPYYIAPEKVKKERVDYRADMYSLGGTIYHALTGVAPFEGDDAQAVVRQRFAGPPRKPSEVRPGLSPQIDFLVMKMLALEPSDRYPSFEALLEDFKRVMTTGLFSTQSVEAAVPSPRTGDAAKSGAARGGRKVMLKPRRKLKMGGKSTATTREDAGNPEDELAETGETGIARRPMHLTNGEEGSSSEDEEGGIGGKIALVIGGLVGVIALVAGGLYGLKVMNESGNAAKDKAAIERNINTAVSSLSNTKTVVADYRVKVEEMENGLIEDCKSVAKAAEQALSGAYSDQVIGMLRMQPPPEVIKAEQDLLLPPGQAPQAAPDAPQPDGVAPQAAQPPAAPQPDGAAPQAAQEEIPPVVNTVRELWEKAYAAKAGALRIRKQLIDLEFEIDKAMTVNERSDAEMRRLGKATNDLKAKFDAIKASPDVTALQKAKGTVKDRGDKALKKALRTTRENRLQKEREEVKKKREQEDKERQEKLAEERAKKVEEETAAAAAKFDAICAAGGIRQLDWDGARRQLGTLGETFSTAEGENAIKRQNRKVDMMESVQKILVRNMKGYTFQRGVSQKGDKRMPHLKGMVVEEVDAKNMTVKRPGAQSSMKRRIPWQTFYRDYHTNLGELANLFIRKGRQNGNPKLKLREYSDAMLGLALTMRIVCSEDETAAAYGETCAKEAVKALPDNLPVAKELFPEIDFAEMEKAAEAERL